MQVVVMMEGEEANDEAEPLEIISTPVPMDAKTPLHELACRQPIDQRMQRAMRRQYVMSSLENVPSTENGNAPLDMVVVMQLWQAFVRRTHRACSDKFWEFFLSLHDQAGVAIDAALNAVKKTFMDRQKDALAWKQFPQSRAKLLKRIDGDFWPHVRHTTRIDLRQLDIPNSIEFLEFTFVDPIFAWIMAARRQRADDMHWRPVRRTNESGNPLHTSSRTFIKHPHGLYKHPHGLNKTSARTL